MPLAVELRISICCMLMNSVTINGWLLHWFHLLATLYSDLESRVYELREKLDDNAFIQHPLVKLYEQVTAHLYEKVPENPLDSKYLLGKTMGKIGKDYRRVKKQLPPRYFEAGMKT